MKYQVKSQCVAGIGADINDSPLDPQLLVLGYVIQQMTSAKAGIGRPPAIEHVSNAGLKSLTCSMIRSE